ncbi:MAG: acyl-CoA dehydrogenase family protein [Myxococcota bacterium]
MEFADPEPLLKQVDELRDLVLAQRAEADRLRRLPDPIADALVARNFYRILLPTDYGGIGADPLTYLRMVERFSALDGSVGWNFAIGGGSSLIAGNVPLEVGRAIFATPSSAVAGAAAPQGKAVAVEGGYRVTGRWAWASGIHQSQWVLAGCIAHTGDPPAPVKTGVPLRHVLVPRESVTVLDTWHVGGLRGTGSTEFVIDDVFVPDDHTFVAFISERIVDRPVFALPSTFFGVALSTVASGVARGAIEAFVSLAVDKRPMMSSNTLAERPAAQYDVAKAEALVDSSREHLFAQVEEMWQTVLAGRPVEMPLRASVRRAQVHAAESAAEAVRLLYRSAGGSSLYESCPLERCFRDVNAALGHVTLQRGVLEDAGRVRFGMRPLGPIF